MASLVRRGSKELLRDINNSRVLQLIATRGPISRAEIAKIAHLPPPTVTAIVSDFIDADLVREVAVDSSSIGRPPVLLALNEQAAFAVGVKLRQDGLTIAVTDLAGGLLYHADAALHERLPEVALRQVADEVHQAIQQAITDHSRVLGLGIGMPGLIDYSRGTCRYSSLLGWRDVDVRGCLEELVGMPVYVDNDVNMLAAAEVAHGLGRGVSEFLVVTIGRGIGLGIVVRGEIYRGAFGGAGEFGHIKIDSTWRCQCGASGCLETLTSDIGICAQIAQLQGVPAISMDDALALAANDAAVRSIFQRAGEVLGRSIGNLLNLFNPQLVIITGEGTRAGSMYLEPMCHAIQSAAFDVLAQDTRVEIQSWGDEAWAQGAASIVVHEMLKPPIYESLATGPLAELLGRRAGQATPRVTSRKRR
jgi:N-acetylglucosamine repressor